MGVEARRNSRLIMSCYLFDYKNNTIDSIIDLLALDYEERYLNEMINIWNQHSIYIIYYLDITLTQKYPSNILKALLYGVVMEILYLNLPFKVGISEYIKLNDEFSMNYSHVIHAFTHNTFSIPLDIIVEQNFLIIILLIHLMFLYLLK